MKILLLTTSYPLNGTPVSGIFISNLVNSFPDDVEIVILTPDSIYKDYSDSNGSENKIIRFRYGFKSWQLLAHGSGGIPVALKNNKFLYFLLPAFILSMFISCLKNSQDCDVIHANWSICGFIAGMASVINGTPMITTLRGEDFNRAKKSFLYRFLLLASIKLGKRIVCVNKTIYTWLIDNYSEHRDVFEVVENGVDEEYLGIKKNYVVNETESPVKLVTVGSLIPRKAIDLIVRAVGELKNELNLSLTIIGEGPEYNKILKLIDRYQIEENIHMAGSILSTEIPEYLARSDIFVLSSFSEGRPNVILEAMASGTPIISSNIEGVAGLLIHESNSLLYEAGSVDALKECVKKIVSRPALLKKYGEEARKNIIEMDLLWKNTVNKYMKIYSDIK